MHEPALFAGAGGGILGGLLLGWHTVCAVENNAYAASVLVARQNDGLLPPFPIWDDVRTFDGRPWRGIVDVVSGGFPCQDISVAGRGAGIDGERSGLWGHMGRIIGEVRPRLAFVENSPALIVRGLGRVLGDLAALGYDCRWGVLGAADVGAPHKRDRLWIVANASGARRRKDARGSHGDEGPNERRPTAQADQLDRHGERNRTRDMADAYGARELQPQGRERDQRGRAGDDSKEVADAGRLDEQGIIASSADTKKRSGSQQRPTGPRGDGQRWWATEPDVGGKVDGMA